MKLNSIKNIQFTRLAKATDKLREFNFRKITGAAEETFHVDVSDDRSNRLMFKMQKGGNGTWKIVSPDLLPQWIFDSENQLHDLIEEELAK